MKITTYTQSSVPILWPDNSNPQPTYDKQRCLPPIVGFFVAYNGCDISVFGIKEHGSEAGESSTPMYSRYTSGV
jgi:hypothetical protein